MSKKKKAANLDLSKAERKALKAREVELAAELARREAKAAKKAKKKAAKLGAIEAQVVADAKAERERKRIEAENAEAAKLADDLEAEKKPKKKSAKRAVEDAAAAALATPSSEGARVAAETAAEAADEATHEETDAEIKARIQAKRAARAAKAAETAPIGGVTSSVEALDAIANPKPETIAKVEAAVEALKAEVEELETERGREFVGSVEVSNETAKPTEEFAKPSEAPKVDFEVNGNGQYKIKRLSDGKLVGYTRTTTYISNLEDRSRLESWKLRMLLEGVAVNDTEPHERDVAGAEPVAAVMADLLHRRDVAIAKARKADRKGKLVVGQLATIVNAAQSEFKKAVDELAESLLEVGGAHEKREKGTDLHALMELADREGIDAVGDLLTEGKITPADLADVEAYLAACERAGIKIVRELIEQPIVVEDLKVAGRLDRVVYVKFPGMTRATRCVGDIKTGNIEYGPGKLAQQLEIYSKGEGYDLDTHERTDLKLSRTKAIVIHVPAGTGTAFVYPVDLSVGRVGNELSGKVRAWRNDGKRAVDFKTDLAAVTS